MPFLTEIYDSSGLQFTVFTRNTNSFYSPRGNGNPSPKSVVFGRYDDTLKRFLDAEDNIYGPPTLNVGGFPFNFGFRQPYVIAQPSDSAFRREIKKFDSRTFPIGSVIQDQERLGKMLVSGHGIKFLATQFLLQAQAPFDETNIYNPLSVQLAAARPASFGLLPRPVRHVQQGTGVLGSFVSMFGFGAKNNSAPSSTVGITGLADAAKQNGTGLLRGKTALGGKAHFDALWEDSPQKVSTSFLDKLKSTFAPALGAEQPDGTEFRADEGAYDSFLNSIASANTPLRIGDPTMDDPFGAGSVFHRYFSGTDADDNVYAVKVDHTIDQFTGTQIVDELETEDDNLRSRFKNSYVTNPTDPKFYTNVNDVEDLAKKINELNEKAKHSGYKDTAGINPELGYWDVGKSTINEGEDIGENSREIKYRFPNASGRSPRERTDSINGLNVLKGDDEFNDFYGETDIIPFYFHDLVNDRYIIFRSTLKGISQNTTPEWVDVKYLGRADRVYLYSGVTRDLSFSFRTYVTQKDHLEIMWNKVNLLQGTCYPSKNVDIADNNSSGGKFKAMVPPFIKLTIGDLYRRVPSIVKSFALSIPDETPWEIDKGNRVPMMADISMTVTLLEDEFALASNDRFYPKSDKTTGT